MSDKVEMILTILKLFGMLLFMDFLEERHKEKYKDYYYVKEYKTPERPREITPHGTRKIKQPPFPKKEE